MKNRFFTIFLFFVLNLGVFAQSSSGDTLDRRVQEAVRRMDELIDGTTGQVTGGNTAPVQASRGGAEPRWVNDPYSVYTRTQYIAAVGHATNRAEAEKSAFASLVAIFGQSLQSAFSEATVYSEAASMGIVAVSSRTDIQNTIVTAASLDTLIGAEIGAVWDNGHGMVFAIAYVNKERTVDIYSTMIRVNLLNIENLFAMSVAEKNTFNGIARYKLAALISGINEKYANVVAQAGGSPSDLFTLTSTDALNIEASNIIKNITVVVRVENDHSNRIRDAFTGVLSGEGLRTRSNNPPYTLEVTVNTNQAVFPGSEYVWCTYTVSGQLVENASDSVLFSYNNTGREGNRTYDLAVNKAVLEIERKINEQYPVMLREYLATQLPRQ